MSNGTQHSFVWHADLSWPNQKIPDGGARAVITAWALDNTPDYMVVGITSDAVANSPRYYPAREFIPGGERADVYLNSSVLMRKIHAKNVTWTMGSAFEIERNAANEMIHEVTLDHNYYIGVLEVTQLQWQNVYNENPTFVGSEGGACAARPVDALSYNRIRCADHSNTRAADAQDYPAEPHAGSFLGVLRQRTGIDFDLPSEAEWEFACRAGHGEGHWGDGSPIVSHVQDANLNCLARYWYTGGVIDGLIMYHGDYSKATAKCGTYAPNSWGLYDMHGNVWEWCLDWYAADITALNGAVNTNSTSGRHVIRGGLWFSTASAVRPAKRSSEEPDSTASSRSGLRLCCRAGLK